MWKKLLMLMACCSLPPAFATTDWPERPVHVIVAYSAGGTGDNLIRLISDQLSEQLGQPIIVENKPGAGGNIASAYVAKAKPDGYTLLLGAANNYTANQYLYPSMRLDPATDLKPVAVLGDVPSVIYINGSLEANDFESFSALAKAKKGEFNYGSPSIGTTPHLVAELINRDQQWDLHHISYKGAAPAVLGLLANDVQFYLGGIGLGDQYVKTGQLKAIAIGAKERVAELPDVPTFEEIGLGHIKASNWWGVTAPKDTPDDVITTLQNAFVTALSDPDTVERLRKMGIITWREGQDETLQNLIKTESPYWEKVISDLDVQIN
ncbi:MAG TPA: tripartite tricarboxylate transporter substrate binding protein [Paenalcaligenes hominis]|uniref:Tripartite tricarboxylate transporter substrate binding protein n=1 Tax=Paenalcaligenes hominis TaxID=643674 RepID=A0A9D2VE93_9BURK|nr:tripartite tricarboxylate transporter substrate binding protein [Paenalcaligenes hominis]